MNGLNLNEYQALTSSLSCLKEIWLGIDNMFYQLFTCSMPHCSVFPANIYLFKVNNKNTRKKLWNMFKVNNKNNRAASWLRSGVFIVNFEHISHLIITFLMLTLNKEILAGLTQISTQKGLWILLNWNRL